ncbi:PREDICTED: protein VASCULAR ASSOCIATED DEATH 1, chloroplastic isoform X2 [Fragaria vesca subsp. vesca]|uniref:protein VASCULAR ASSOCIATED DEATH 1, chloroplastic isoform X2 n=1 Tax=Fragaria vesca subsp. vesca TaxID=101020 RepID=UPI0002C32088|nr:PREDICTED: protein VASCULAR ASSOCIATED DEATH 1, chloroplastic isoform X2 [Fragaria vesca subsp. vesca]
MAVASASPDRIQVSPQQQHPVVEPSPSRFSTDSDAASSSPLVSCSPADTPDRSDPSYASPSSADQSAARLRSEEYRQLFRLPPDEALIEDFNCAFQENILIQGHMYLFVHHICFYSNIFGYETKKVIPFQEVTSVRRAKTAGIFPNAIEIFAGDKKYFFASFLSRDEAYRIINDGWAQYVDGAKVTTEQLVLESISETKNQENGIVIKKVESSNCLVNEVDSTDRNANTHISEDSELPPKVEDDSVLSSLPEPEGVVEEDIEPVLNGEPSSSRDTLIWKEEDSDAPNIPDFYTKVAESQFPIKVEDFFRFFFSDDVFIESFHKSCGDKDFRCTSWHPHEKFGHARDVSFQHPIKIYFGAKFGSCQELQKFRVHKNSHLVIETSQEINDVPYGDYFRVEGLWNVERDTDGSKECCNLKIYLNVAFSKRTVWKGKIVQSTLEECREVFATWINMAHEFLKKNLEKPEDSIPTASTVQKCEVRPADEAETVQSSEKFYEPRDDTTIQQISASIHPKQQVNSLFQESPSDAYTRSSLLRDYMMKFGSSLRSQSHLPLIIVVIVAVIFIMQLSILALLVRPQHIHVHSPVDYTSGVGGRSSEVITWLEKRVHTLKDDMNLVEARLESMRREHALLKAQLEDFKHLNKRK